MMSRKPTTIDEYISALPPEVAKVMQAVRRTVRAAAPQATEKISYAMPAFMLNGRPLVYFGAWTHHIGFYATPSGNVAFQKEIAPYKHDKGSIQFPLDKPMPFDLITKIAKFRVAEVLAEQKKRA